ncbi:MAG TPA: excinuclease ABC subunit UvrC [Catalimonadaceae bacterium]|nr:excinuclease ABC subunit UvrC [Catalimonadaceae bacterium]
MLKDNYSSLTNLPEHPGVYKYFSEEGILIYVGKAKNLKKRVSSYFTKTYTDRKTARLVSQIHHIEFTLVDNEYDALLLENSLIKQHQPRYNINLKDDKSYPYLIITSERYPKIYPTRRRIADKGNYYGPFASVRMMKALLELFKKVFTFRSCNLVLSEDNVRKKKFKVCLEFHLGNCKGPCVGLQDEKEYLEEIEQARQIIKGKTGLAKQYFREKMQEYAAELEFEKAQKAKVKLELIENWQSHSVVVNPDMDDLDVFAMSSQDDNVYINFLAISEGSISQTHTFEFKKKLDETDPELVGHAIVLAKEIFDSRAKELISNVVLDFDIPGVQTHVPQRGEKKKLLDLALKNVLYYKKEKITRAIEAQSDNRTDRILNKMKSDLRLDRLPKRIECFDNSNIQGTNPVSAMVCFIDAAPAKKEYRHFNVKTVVGPDDFATMFEVVSRRYKRQLEENQPLPDLILIDGGKGQLSSACEALKSLGLYGSIPIVGIAKRLEELYYPEDPYPLYLDKKSETLKVLQRARDEAHRFGITFHRSKRSKASLKTALESVKGLGNKSVEFIYKRFQSIGQIRETEHREEIEKELGKARTDALFAFLAQGYQPKEPQTESEES